MQVTRISIYPIKGTREISLTQAAVRPRGLGGDRRWMVVDPEGSFLQQRVEPRMACIHTLLSGDGTLRIDAPDMPPLEVSPPAGDQRITVKVWSDTVSAAMSDPRVDEWFSAYLRRPCHLVYMDRDAHRGVSHQRGQPGDVVSFADAMPLLLASDASLADLNTRLDRKVAMANFRPNVTIDGFEPWEEDGWLRIRVGDVEFELTHPCARCVVTTIDQPTGIKSSDGEPLKTLATFRRGANGVYFGQNLVPRSLGTIRVGDPVIVSALRME